MSWARGETHKAAFPLRRTAEIVPVDRFYITAVKKKKRRREGGEKYFLSPLPATIYSSLHVMLCDDVVVLFRINYGLPEVSYVTKV